MAKARVTPVKELLLASSEPARKGNPDLALNPGLGSSAYSDKAMAPKFNQPIVKKQVSGRNTWADTALVLVERAKKASQTYGKKDFNALYRLVLSAGIAYDKAFPTVQQVSSGNLIVQLFGSLGSDTTRAILEPPRPTIDVAPSTVDDLEVIPDKL